MMAAHVPAGAVEIGCLGYDLEAFLGIEYLAQAAANDGMVVGDHDANRSRRSGVGGVWSVHGVSCLRQRSHRNAARSRDSRYGARCLAAIFPPGDQSGVPVASELEPWPPVMWAVRYNGA